MDFHEVNATLKRVGEILNRRLLMLEGGQDDQYYAITAADLLLKRPSEASAGTEEQTFRETEEEVREMLTAPEKLARVWWEEWTRSYFPTLVPRTQWKTISRNVQVGDMALLRYTTKYNAPSYRLCRIVGVKVGEDGQVRSCEVTLRPRRKGEDQGEKDQHKKLATITVGVQRIAVILPVEEQEGEEGGRSQLQEEPRSEEDSQGQEGPTERLQEGPTDGPQGGPTEELQGRPAEELQERSTEELQEDPVDRPQEGPKKEMQGGPAEKLKEGSMEEPQDGPQEGPTEELQEGNRSIHEEGSSDTAAPHVH